MFRSDPQSCERLSYSLLPMNIRILFPREIVPVNGHYSHIPTDKHVHSPKVKECEIFSVGFQNFERKLNTHIFS